MEEEICVHCPHHFTHFKSNVGREVVYCRLAFKEGRKSREAVCNYKAVKTVKVQECRDMLQAAVGEHGGD